MATTYIVCDKTSGLFFAGSSLRPISALRRGTHIHSLMSNRAGDLDFLFSMETEGVGMELQELINTCARIANALNSTDDLDVIFLNVKRRHLSEKRINTEAARALLDYLIAGFQRRMNETLWKKEVIRLRIALAKAKNLRKKLAF